MNNWFDELTDFSNDPLGIKSALFLITLLIIAMFIASALGIDEGRGGNPQGSYQEEQYEDY